jgi:mannose-6-phosphate isomerase-like protein (cupin superfamily)
MLESSGIRKIRKEDAKVFMEGDEYCHLYYKTHQQLFGTSSLMPGMKGAVDPGHKHGNEVFFVARGTVICHFPKKNTSVELAEGDVVVVPPGEPHGLMNPGSSEAVVCWSLAPPD